MRVLGWSRAKNKVGDETGIWHLIIADDLPHIPRASQACGSRGSVSGQVEKLDGHPCGRCKILATRLGVMK
jgi:hypothetical protein